MNGEIDIKLYATENLTSDATVQVNNDLIILHAKCISAQWPLDNVGVKLDRQSTGIIKLGFFSMENPDFYQAFYFDSRDYEKIEKFFKSHGFPMPRDY